MKQIVFPLLTAVIVLVEISPAENVVRGRILEETGVSLHEPRAPDYPRTMEGLGIDGIVERADEFLRRHFGEDFKPRIVSISLGTSIHGRKQVWRWTVVYQYKEPNPPGNFHRFHLRLSTQGKILVKISPATPMKPSLQREPATRNEKTRSLPGDRKGSRSVFPPHERSRREGPGLATRRFAEDAPSFPVPASAMRFSETTSEPRTKNQVPSAQCPIPASGFPTPMTNHPMTILRRSLAILTLLLFTQPLLAFYCPTSGRFLSRDPIGEEGGANLYAFVRNGPVQETDLLGLSSETCRSCTWTLFFGHIGENSPDPQIDTGMEAFNDFRQNIRGCNRIKLYTCGGNWLNKQLPPESVVPGLDDDFLRGGPFSREDSTSFSIRMSSVR